MDGVRHDGSTVGQPAPDKLDYGKGDIKEERPANSIGRGIRVVVSVIVHTKFLWAFLAPQTENQ